MFHPDIITVYTDGSSRGNPGPGGCASIVVLGKDRVIEVGGKDSHTTNNKMELQGVITGLNVSLKYNEGKFKKIEVFSDSKYVLQGITTWIHNWKKNNWRTAAKAPVLNQELWQELDSVATAVSQSGVVIMWTYVKGHSENKFNERADVIATTCADATTDEVADKGQRIFYDGDLASWGV